MPALVSEIVIGERKTIVSKHAVHEYPYEDERRKGAPAENALFFIIRG
jgi:hypothetical protein